MHRDYTRYAVYWVPRYGTDLAAFGRGWTGWCAEAGTPAKDEASRTFVTGHPGQIWKIALHGLHAPLAFPFRLAPGRSHWRLEQSLRELAKGVAPILLPRFQITVRRGRVVLALERPCDGFDALRGKIMDSVSLVSRRRKSRLINAELPGGITIPSGEVHAKPLIEPFVIPLTDTMDAPAAYDLAADLYAQLSQVLALPQRVSDVALMGDPGGDRPWRLIERYRLTGVGTARAQAEPVGMACPDPRPMPPVTSLMGSDWDTVIG